MKNTVLFFLAIIFAGLQGISAAEIDQSLQTILNDKSDDEYIQVLVFLSDQADIQALDKQLKSENATLAERNRRVILALHDTATRTQPIVSSLLDEMKADGLIRDYRMYWISNMLWADIKKNALGNLAVRDDLGTIYYNYDIEGIKPMGEGPGEGLLLGHEIGLTKINAPAAWAEGWTGRGRVVMNIDTGVLGSHPALSERFRGDVDGDGDVSESWLDPYITRWANPNDVGGHGTHTMGTMCGRSASGDTIGVAIDAQWIAAAAIDRGGGISRTIADAIASFQWAVDPDDNPDTQDNPDAIGNSWGLNSSHGVPPCDQTFWSYIDNCEAAGSVVIFSAGNEGPNSSTIRRPADRGTTPTNCFSVGAVDGRQDNLPIASFSSRGPSDCGPNGEQVIKPEVVAPGYQVRSSYLGGTYTTMNGTSMASPHITGAVAVIRQVNPNLDADAIKNILLETAVDLPITSPDGEDNSYGWGIIDLYRACIAAQRGYGRISGFVGDSLDYPIPGVLVTVQGRADRDETDEEGNFLMALPADSAYTFHFARFGYMPAETTIALLSNDTAYVQIVLPLSPGGVLYGAVTDGMSPIANATVEIVGAPLTPAHTDLNGIYRFPSIPGDSTYTVRVRAIGHALGQDTIFVATGDSALLNFSLAAFESFEQTDAYWHGTGVWEWGQPTSGPGSAFDGTNLWATNLDGNYNNNSDDMLYSFYYSIDQQFDTLTFYHWYEFENSYDGGNVCISTDEGLSWILITPDGNYPDDQVTGLDNLPGYTGSTGAWRQAIFPLNNCQGQFVQFRFWIGTNASITRSGWYIDGVRLKRGAAWAERNPEISLSQNSLSIGLNPGDSAALPLTIFNTGEGILIFRIADFTRLLSLPGDANPPMILDMGGPDSFGYLWIDSDEPNGPDFSWVDISNIGQELDLNDDDNDGPFNLGFIMPFYGSNFNAIWICSNGWLSFSSLSTAWDNRAIPNTLVPNDLVAAFWDDIDPDRGGSAYYYTNNSDSGIVSWVGIPNNSGIGSFTFQIILTANGNISMQYLTMDGAVDSSSVGIENSAGTVGLQVAYNQEYIGDSLTVLFKMPQDWLDVSPDSDMLVPAGEAQINAYFNAANLDPGQYLGYLNVISNDIDEPSVVIPCTLRVGPVAVDDSRSNLPITLELGQNYPNPFNPTTQITFALPSRSHIELAIYDLLGRRIRKLIDGELDAGRHNAFWDGRDDSGVQVTSGAYFYALKTDDYLTSRKMILMK